MGSRKGWVKKYFGDENYAYLDTSGKKTVEFSQLLPNHTYELKTKSPDSPPRFIKKADRKYVTFVTELGRHEKVEVKDSDSETGQSAILRNLNIFGATRILIKGREITWTDLRDGDEAIIERITDAAVYIKTEKDKESYELKYLQSDPASAGKMAQQLWPGRSLLRKFERAPPSTWTT
jgi:hypothetical protein